MTTMAGCTHPRTSHLDLGPLTRVLVQHEEDNRAGMTLSTSDVRAMVDEIVRLSRAVLKAREYANGAILALLDHDLPKVRQLLDAIAGPLEDYCPPNERPPKNP